MSFTITFGPGGISLNPKTKWKHIFRASHATVDVFTKSGDGFHSTVTIQYSFIPDGIDILVTHMNPGLQITKRHQDIFGTENLTDENITRCINRLIEYLRQH